VIEAGVRKRPAHHEALALEGTHPVDDAGQGSVVGHWFAHSRCNLMAL
jgi:hypothetical protein